MPDRSLETALTGLLVLCMGCYSADSLIEKTRNKAIRTRIDEVEIGSFRVTLPNDEVSGEMTEIDLRLFAESERYKINEIKSELESKAPQIEDRTLRTLRDLTREELADPDLKGLRKRLLFALNDELTDTPLRAIGFYDVRFTRH